jgi:hypothetical protein
MAAVPAKPGRVVVVGGCSNEAMSWQEAALVLEAVPGDRLVWTYIAMDVRTLGGGPMAGLSASASPDPGARAAVFLLECSWRLHFGRS